MGGVKELFKDEKQIKNLNPAKMGKVAIMKDIDMVNIIANLYFRCIKVWLRPWTLTCSELLVVCKVLRA